MSVVGARGYLTHYASYYGLLPEELAAAPLEDVVDTKQGGIIATLKQTLNGILSKHTGKPIDQVEKDCDRDNYMTAEEAKNYGLVDQVVQSRKEIPGVEKSSVAV